MTVTCPYATFKTLASNLGVTGKFIIYTVSLDPSGVLLAAMLDTKAPQTSFLLSDLPSEATFLADYGLAVRVESIN